MSLGYPRDLGWNFDGQTGSDAPRKRRNEIVGRTDEAAYVRVLSVRVLPIEQPTDSDVPSRLDGQSVLYSEVTVSTHTGK